MARVFHVLHEPTADVLADVPPSGSELAALLGNPGTLAGRTRWAGATLRFLAPGLTVERRDGVALVLAGPEVHDEKAAAAVSALTDQAVLVVVDGVAGGVLRGAVAAVVSPRWAAVIDVARCPPTCGCRVEVTCSYGRTDVVEAALGVATCPSPGVADETPEGDDEDEDGDASDASAA